MEYLPIFMNLKGRHALIIGGGIVASRKAALVLKSGATMHIVSPVISKAMQTLIDENDFEYKAEVFEPAHLNNMHLVIAATDDSEVNHLVYTHADARGIPVNVADKTELCSFILPAIVDRDPVIVAVSTGGRSPVLARFIKSKLETMIPAAFGQLATLLGRFRQLAKDVVSDPAERRIFWEEALDGPIAEKALAGDMQSAEAQLVTKLEAHSNAFTNLNSRIGEVYLIGAGPGDPDLMTFRGQRLLQKADVVLYDRLVPSGILEMCRREAEMVYVGKRKDQHTIPQHEMSQMMVDYARKGKCVARLKGGDPFVFGRGGEELEVLSKNGINFQVVPGISSANGVSAYSGIPLTHRDHASGVSFYTAHRKAKHLGGTLDLNWANMINEHHTNVFFMGLGALEEICERLIEHGMPASFPAAMISHGTTKAQRVETGTLSTLAMRVKRAGLSSPALLIVGKVVELREQLNWYANEYSLSESFKESAVNYAGELGLLATNENQVSNTNG